MDGYALILSKNNKHQEKDPRNSLKLGRYGEVQRIEGQKALLFSKE